VESGVIGFRTGYISRVIVTVPYSPSKVSGVRGTGDLHRLLLRVGWVISDSEVAV
jgi:hypothetical protein